MKHEEEAASPACVTSYSLRSARGAPVLTWGAPEPPLCRVRTRGGGSVNEIERARDRGSKPTALTLVPSPAWRSDLTHLSPSFLPWEAGGDTVLKALLCPVRESARFVL